jgi:hypothetical protein
MSAWLPNSLQARDNKCSKTRLQVLKNYGPNVISFLFRGQVKRSKHYLHVFSSTGS